MSGHISLPGKIALVTGGARGIGAATVEKLLAAGASVAVVDRDIPEHTLTSERVLLLSADVTDYEAMVECVRRTVEKFGALDIVIANAGITPPPSTIRTIDRNVFDTVMAVNFGGVLNTVRACADDIVAGGGHIMLVSSCAAFTPGMGGAPYMVSKAAVEQLGRGEHVSVAASGPQDGGPGRQRNRSHGRPRVLRRRGHRAGTGNTRREPTRCANRQVAAMAAEQAPLQRPGCGIARSFRVRATGTSHCPGRVVAVLLAARHPRSRACVEAHPRAHRRENHARARRNRSSG